MPSFKDHTTSYTGTIVDINSSTITIDIDGSLHTYEVTNTSSYTKKSVVKIELTADNELLSIEIIDTYTIDDYINDLIKTMTIEEKIGQLFLVRYDSENYEAQLEDYHIGGIIFFAKDFRSETKDSVKKRSDTLQSSSNIPLLMAVDEEGGVVNRISLYKAFRGVPFWSSQDLYNEGGWNLVISDTIEKSTLLKELGMNVNMGPVVDVSTNSTDYIFKRSFGKHALLTADYATHVVRTMDEQQIGSVLKHFPGYGNNKDTHTGIAIDNRDYETFLSSDFLPFIAGIEAGSDAVLVSHNIVTCMDDVPASLSSRVHEILRNDLAFDGVIMCDDLFMDAITTYTDNQNAAISALLAGNDLLCCTNYEEQVPAAIEAAKNGVIPIKQIDESLYRVLNWKYELGLLTIN